MISEEEYEFHIAEIDRLLSEGEESLSHPDRALAYALLALARIAEVRFWPKADPSIVIGPLDPQHVVQGAKTSLIKLVLDLLGDGSNGRTPAEARSIAEALRRGETPTASFGFAETADKLQLPVEFEP